MRGSTKEAGRSRRSSRAARESRAPRGGSSRSIPRDLGLGRAIACARAATLCRGARLLRCARTDRTDLQRGSERPVRRPSRGQRPWRRGARKPELRRRPSRRQPEARRRPRAQRLRRGFRRRGRRAQPGDVPRVRRGACAAQHPRPPARRGPRVGEEDGRRPRSRRDAPQRLSRRADRSDGRLERGARGLHRATGARHTAKDLRAAYGVYLLAERRIWAPRHGSAECVGLAYPPADHAGFGEFADAVVQSERIGPLLAEAPIRSR